MELETSSKIVKILTVKLKTHRIRSSLSTIATGHARKQTGGKEPFQSLWFFDGHVRRAVCFDKKYVKICETRG